MLPEPKRMAIFFALVQMQDGGASVAESQQVIAEQLGLTERLVRRIEQEGLEKDWPPLSDAAYE